MNVEKRLGRIATEAAKLFREIASLGDETLEGAVSVIHYAALHATDHWDSPEPRTKKRGKMGT